MKTIKMILKALFEGLAFGTKIAAECTQTMFRRRPILTSFLWLLGITLLVTTVYVGIETDWVTALVYYAVAGTIMNLFSFRAVYRCTKEEVINIVVL